MTVETLLLEAQAAGITIEVAGEQLRLRGCVQPPEDLIRRLRQHLSELIGSLRGAQPTQCTGISAIPQALPAAAGRVMNLIPGSTIATAIPKLPPLGEGESCAIYLSFEDGGVERYRRSEHAPLADRGDQTSKRAGSQTVKRSRPEAASLYLPFEGGGRSPRTEPT
jgi:hypothetical protein